MEKIIRFFVERHLLVNVLTAAVVVLGLLALMRTNVAGFPEATLPMYLVSASLPGAAAKDVETKIFEHGVYPDRCGPFGIARMVASFERPRLTVSVTKVFVHRFIARVKHVGATGEASS